MISYSIKATHRFAAIAAGAHTLAAAATTRAALDVVAHAKARARVDTGFMRGAIHGEPVNALEWDVISPAYYSIFNELGTIHMSAQPFMRPAIEVVFPTYMAALAKIGSL
jgi:HK97 gp10 family phage protein